MKISGGLFFMEDGYQHPSQRLYKLGHAKSINKIFQPRITPIFTNKTQSTEVNSRK
jgi:hypothetical protein